MVSGLVSIFIMKLSILGFKTQLLHLSRGAAQYMLILQENNVTNFIFELVFQFDSFIEDTAKIQDNASK